MNITLRDLVRWRDSTLYAAGVVAEADREHDLALLHPERAVSWPVTMRAATPMLPHVDEGAIVLLPQATLAEVRPALPGVLHELRRRNVAALVIDPGETLGTVACDLDVLHARNGVIHDLELLLTRLLNERRARLYRRGTEIDRALTEATLHGQGAPQLLRIGAAQSGHEFFLLDQRGTVKEVYRSGGAAASVPTDGTTPRPPAPPLGVDAPLAPVLDPAHGIEWLICPLDRPLNGASPGWLALWGPVGTLDESARFLLLRVAAACGLALGRRGPSRLSPARRAALVADLLWADWPPAERTLQAETLGLDPTDAYAVLLLGHGPRGEREGGARALHAARRQLSARIAPQVASDDFACEPAGTIGLLLHAADPAAITRATLSLRAPLAPASPGVVAVLSEPGPGTDRLPVAGRQAEYALMLLRDEALAGPFVDWSAVDDLGPYRLLYPLWGTPEAARFVADVLGVLPEYDARYGGELLATLLAYLRHGGAAGTAAAQLAIHRNTLTYRLRRIEDVSGRSPLDPSQQLSLHLAVLLHLLPPPPGRATKDE